MPILTKPSLYSFSGNCDDIVVVSLAKVNFKLTVGSVVLTEVYTPYMGKVTIPLRSLLESLIKGFDAVDGSQPITKVIYTVDSVEEFFYCLSGGVRNIGNIEAWLKNNFLTWRPQVIRTTFHSPQYLSYASLGTCVVKAKGYFASGDQVINLKTLSAGTIYNIDVTWGNMVGKFRESPKYIDFWVEGTGIKSYTQRFCLMQNADCQDVFVWVNSVGGVDTAIFTGDLVHTQNSNSSTAIVDQTEIEFGVDYSSVYKKYTGYITEGNDQLWTLDFFNSAVKYHLSDSNLRRIVVSKPKTERTKGEIAGYEFEFFYSDQSKYLNLPRLGDDQLLVFLDEGEELFFLTPRLNSFAGVSVGVGDILFPVQYAHLEQWFKMPLVDILSMFTVGPHVHQISDVVGLDDRLTELENSGGGSNPTVPTSHASSHATGGIDPITPKAIGASAEDHAHDDRYAKINGDPAQNFATKNLDVKGLAVFGDAIVMSGYEGGGGGSLPAGNLDEVLYFNGTDWVGKHKDTLGFLTLSALSGYATIDWVTARIPSVPAWALQANKPSYGWSEITSKPTEFTPSAHNQAIATITGLQGVLDTKLAKSIWDSEFNVTSEGLVHKRTAIFNDAIVMSNATGGGGGTTDYNALENLPFIGGVKVSGSKTLADYGLMGFDLATQAWVNTRIPNVSAWALQANKPSYTAIEVGALNGWHGWISDMLKIRENGVYGYASDTINKPYPYGVTLNIDNGNWYYQLAFDTGGSGIHYYRRINSGDYNYVGALYHSGNLVPASVTNAGNTLVQRDASGFVFGRIFNGNFPTHNQPFGEVGYRVSPEDGYHRFCSVDYFKSQLGLYHTGNLVPASTGITPNTLAQRDASGYLEARIFRDNWGLDGSSSIGAVGFKINQADGYHRFCTPDRFKSQLGLWSTSNLAVQSTLTDANTVAVTGTYRVFDSSINTPINLAGQSLLHFEWDVNAGAQMFFGYSAEQYCLRRKSSNNWSPWRSIYHSGNSNLPTVDWTMKNAHINGNINIASAGLGTIQIGNTGLLTGYPSSAYPTIKTSFDVMYFDLWGRYAGAVSSGEGYFNIHQGANTNGVRVKGNFTVNSNQIVEGTAIFKGAIVMNNY